MQYWDELEVRFKRDTTVIMGLDIGFPISMILAKKKWVDRFSSIWLRAVFFVFFFGFSDFDKTKYLDQLYIIYIEHVYPFYIY